MGIAGVTQERRSSGGWLRLCQARLGELWRIQPKRRSLAITETAGLGGRRFVAVVQFERQRFLIGGTPGSVTLLAHLPEAETNESNGQ